MYILCVVLEEEIQTHSLILFSNVRLLLGVFEGQWGLFFLGRLKRQRVEGGRDEEGKR